MSRRWSIALLRGCLVLSLGWGVLATAAEAADLARGEKIYKLLCEKCHGKEGKGDGPKAKELDKTPSDYTQAGFFAQRSEASLREMIVIGNAPMPSFELKLSPEDIDNVLAYIKTFAAK